MLKFITKVEVFARSLHNNEEGVTAIEYGLIAGAIAVAIIGVLIVLGEDITAMFGATSSALKSVTP